MLQRVLSKGGARRERIALRGSIDLGFDIQVSPRIQRYVELGACRSKVEPNLRKGLSVDGNVLERCGAANVGTIDWAVALEVRLADDPSNRLRQSEPTEHFEIDGIHARCEFQRISGAIEGHIPRQS